MEIYFKNTTHAVEEIHIEVTKFNILSKFW
jgi:hypothetical protein